MSSRFSLRSLFAAYSALPQYVNQANTVSPARAERIARAYGLILADCYRDLAQANQYGQERQTRADLKGNGNGLFPNAENLFAGYLYDGAYEADCDSREAARRES